MDPFKCEHKKVVLRDKFTKDDRGTVVFREWSIDAQCPLCGTNLNEKQIETALKQIYAPDIADIMFQTYTHKKAYFERITELSTNGIECSLFLPDRNERPS